MLSRAPRHWRGAPSGCSRHADTEIVELVEHGSCPPDLVASAVRHGTEDSRPVKSLVGGAGAAGRSAEEPDRVVGVQDGLGGSRATEPRRCHCVAGP